MAPDVDAPAVTLERLMEHFMPVEPGNIEAEFERIWEGTAQGSSGDPSSVRLRVSNVLAWGTEATASARFEDVMEALAQRHPCRGMLALVDASLPRIESAISAHCWRMAGGGRHICSEEIVLRGPSGREQELASAVLALLVPELPVYVWLLGEPDAHRRLPPDLLDVADRVHVDSASASIAVVGLRAIAAAVADGDPVVTDLAWQRTAIWRDLVAQLFDSVAARPLLDDVTAIRIEGGAGHVSSAAMLLAGWLASRLGLNAANVEGSNTLISATCYDGTHAVELRCEPSAAGLELGRVALTAGGAELYVELHDASKHLHVRSDYSSEPVHRIVAPDAVDDASVLLRALEEPEDAAVFAAALNAALSLIPG